MDWVVGTIHPAFVLRQNRRYEGVVRHDLTRAVKLAHGYTPATWDESKYILRPDAAKVEKVLRSMHGKRVAFDIETDGHHPLLCTIRCIAFYDGEKAICVPFVCRDGTTELVEVPGKKKKQKRAVWKPYFAGPALERVKRAIQELFNHTEENEGWNAQYDSLCLRARLGIVVPHYYDGILDHHVIASYFPHSLAFCTSLYTEYPYYKTTDDGDAWSSESDVELWRYNNRDVEVTHLISAKLRTEIKRPEDRRLSLHDHRKSVVCEEMKLGGVQIDTAARDLLAEHYRTVAAKSLQKMREMVAALDVPALEEELKSWRVGFTDEVGDDDEVDATPFNPGSLIQLRKVLHGLGVPLSETTATGQLSTAKDVLLGIRKELLIQKAKADDPRIAFIDYLFSWREHSKILSTFLCPELVWHGPNGELSAVELPGYTPYVHPTYNPFVVPSGRLASKSPNCQNQPSEIRAIYVPRKGHVFVTGDWDSGEQRLSALLSGDKRLTTAFVAYDAKTGPKVHILNASAIFKIPVCDGFDKKYPGIYRAAKVFAYACVRKGTKVVLLNGKRAIEKCQPGDWTWCWDGGKQVPTRIKAVYDNGTRECVRLTVRDGVGRKRSVVVTPDHRVMRRDGTYCRVDELRFGDRLMPFRRYTTTNGYAEFDPFNDGSRWYEHRWVAEQLGSLDEHVHHRNGNRLDNRPGNLEGTTNADHRRLHGSPKLGPEARERVRVATIERWGAKHDEVNAQLVEGRRKSKWWKGQHENAARRYQEALRGTAVWEAAGKPRGVHTCFCCRTHSPKLAKGLCRKCYLVTYNHKPNHVVVSIEAVAPQPVWDIEVEHPAHNFPLADVGIQIHNCAYGAGPQTVFEKVREEMPDMQYADFLECYENYKKASPELFAYMAKVVQRGTQNHFLDSEVLKRRIYFFEPAFDGRDSVEASAMMNFPLQSGIADVVDLAMFRLLDTVLPKYRKLCRKGEVVRLATQVHDELLFELPERMAKDFMADYKRVAEEAPDAAHVDWKGKLPVDVGTKRRWKALQLPCGVDGCTELVTLEREGESGRVFTGTCGKCKKPTRRAV